MTGSSVNLPRSNSSYAVTQKQERIRTSQYAIMVYHQHARGFYLQYICYVWWTCFSTDSRHTYEYKLSSSRRLVPLFVGGILHTGASHVKRKEASPIH